MKLDRRLTNGLAWAGALLVVGVPTADYFIGQFEQSQPQLGVVDAGNSLSTTTPVIDASSGSTAEVAAPERPAAAGDVVESYLDGGRPLPSYISGEDVAPAAAKPTETAAVPAQPAPAQAAPSPSVAAPVAVAPSAPEVRPVIETAALPPKVAPVPMPLSMRPRAPVAVAPSAPVLILDEPVPVLQAAPVLQPAPTLVEPPGVVTADDLAGWETGPLSDFLAQRQQQGSSAVYQVQPNENVYEPGGFWLDDAPREGRGNRGFPQAYDDGDFMEFAP